MGPIEPKENYDQLDCVNNTLKCAQLWQRPDAKPLFHEKNSILSQPVDFFLNRVTFYLYRARFILTGRLFTQQGDLLSLPGEIYLTGGLYS